jgi:hypothetical protein
MNGAIKIRIIILGYDLDPARSFFNAGCTYLENLLALNEHSAEPVSQVTQEPVPTETKEPTPLST